jgi:hypothetical protein
MISDIAGTSSPIRYRVVIGGVSIVYDGDDLPDAVRLFRLFFTLGCPVALFKGYEILSEFHPDRE